MSERQPVTVIGLGPMGKAMVREFLKAKNPVTVWNRTESKTDELADEGAIKAESLAAAIDANDLIVVSLTHYDAVAQVLEPVADHLPGKVIANLTSGSPEETRQSAEWVQQQGGQQLTGGPITGSDDLTHELNYVFYSGPRELFDQHRDTLAVLSRPEYIGPKPETANLFYQSLLTMFHPTLLAFEQARATVERHGVDPELIVPYLQEFTKTLPDFMAFTNLMARSGGWGDVDNLRMMRAGAQHVIDTGRAVGVDTAITDAVSDFYQKSLDATEKKGEPVPTYQVIRGF